jgi:hypothetical protein
VHEGQSQHDNRDRYEYDLLKALYIQGDMNNNGHREDEHPLGYMRQHHVRGRQYNEPIEHFPFQVFRYDIGYMLH